MSGTIYPAGGRAFLFYLFEPFGPDRLKNKYTHTIFLIILKL